MRKSTKVMAGLGVVAGLGIALAPLATFAASAGSNTLELNINSNCTVDSTLGNISGTWAETTEAGAKDVDLIKGGEANDTLKFSCNQNSKVKVYAAATALTGPEVIPVTSVKAKYSAVGTGMTISNGWDASAYKAFTNTDATQIASGTAPASGDFGVKVDGYKVTITANQQAGSYTGTVTYTFDNVANL